MVSLRDRGGELRAAGVQPFGISRDSPWTHVAWTQALDLDFPLLSDWNGEATHGFGITYEHRGLKDVSARSAFVRPRSTRTSAPPSPTGSPSSRNRHSSDAPPC